MTTMEKMSALMNDTAALERILAAGNPNELMIALAVNGIEVANVSKEEAYAIFQRAKSGELTVQDLDEVAGGFSWSASGGLLTKVFGASVTNNNGRARISTSKGLFGFAFLANLQVHQSSH